ncbi:MAG: RNB domain-containing ribonuclease, partial [Deltaproteobacteria bacterium]|nr:RNB domain-containing ribonuclease [Deltaproteobacteria bacterium]
FAFGAEADADRVSAVVRAFFEDRLYFRFDNTRFFPHTEEQVEEIRARAAREKERAETIEAAAAWLKEVMATPGGQSPPRHPEFEDLLYSTFLFDGEAPRQDVVKPVLRAAGIRSHEDLFGPLVRLGILSPWENVEALRLEVPREFPDEVAGRAILLSESPGSVPDPCQRRDLTGLSLITVDGQSTADFDDALSVEADGDYLRLGVHISDVAHFIRRKDLLDAEAAKRGSSIYMPDEKIPMFPPVLADGLLSLHQGAVRPAVSLLIQLDREANVLDYEITQSLVRVQRQMTYHDANLMANEDKEIILLVDLAQKLRERRLDAGALHISLPEVNVWVSPEKDVSVHRIHRESASRSMVAEFMILANRLFAEFLRDHDCPAVFRSQPAPNKRLFERDRGSLYENWMQRRQLSRFVLSPDPAPHSGLGVEAYTTGTSPIRKYLDLVTQRQVRGVLGLETPYSREEIEEIIMNLERPLSKVSRLQFTRTRYWLIHYLRSRMGQKEDALVLDRRRDRYMVLLTETMVEAPLPITSGTPSLSPEDHIKVKVTKADPRTLTLSLEPA